MGAIPGRQSPPFPAFATSQSLFGPAIAQPNSPATVGHIHHPKSAALPATPAMPPTLATPIGPGITGNLNGPKTMPLPGAPTMPRNPFPQIGRRLLRANGR